MIHYEDKKMNIADAIKLNHEEGWGLDWDLFWEFRSTVDHLDLKYTTVMARRLMCYLGGFGMMRNTGLAQCTMADFETFYAESVMDFRAIEELRFGRISEDERTGFETAWLAIQQRLSKIEVAGTETMVSKILMAVTGTMPAFDSRFTVWYRKEFNPGSANTFNKLITIQGRYHKQWRRQMSNLPKFVRHTRTGAKRPIPPARLIDMAGWWLGDPVH